MTALLDLRSKIDKQIEIFIKTLDEFNTEISMSEIKEVIATLYGYKDYDIFSEDINESEFLEISEITVSPLSDQEKEEILLFYMSLWTPEMSLARFRKFVKQILSV